MATSIDHAPSGGGVAVSSEVSGRGGSGVSRPPAAAPTPLRATAAGSPFTGTCVRMCAVMEGLCAKGRSARGQSGHRQMNSGSVDLGWVSAEAHGGVSVNVKAWKHGGDGCRTPALSARNILCDVHVHDVGVEALDVIKHSATSRPLAREPRHWLGCILCRLLLLLLCSGFSGCCG